MKHCETKTDKTDGRYPFDTVNEMIERHLSDIHAEDETTTNGKQKPPKHDAQKKKP